MPRHTSVCDVFELLGEGTRRGRGVSLVSKEAMEVNINMCIAKIVIEMWTASWPPLAMKLRPSASASASVNILKGTGTWYELY